MKPSPLRSLSLALALATLGSQAVQGAQLFGAKETHLSLFGDYVEKPNRDWGGGFAIDYFASEYLGFGITSHWEEWQGTAYENLAGELLLRIPIESLRLAPYGVGSVGFDFRDHRGFEGVGGGVELRFQKGWGLFGDYQYLFRRKPIDTGFIRFGLQVKF